VSFANREIASRNGLAFTVNLAPDVIAVANDNSLGFTDYMSRKLKRVVKRLLRSDPSFWLGVHVTKEGRPHLHGAMDAAPDAAPVVKAALKEVGGDWTAAARQFQVKLRRLEAPDGWVRYVFRGLPHARRHVPGKIITITNPLRTAAAKLYEVFRERLVASPDIIGALEVQRASVERPSGILAPTSSSPHH
jgi:hypothetical protein